MRVVPKNKLLIQPTVQARWIEQHRSIEFELDDDVLTRFCEIWHLLEATNEPLKQFLLSSETERWALYDDDRVFALLTGADYLRNLYPSFRSYTQAGRLIWSISG